MRLDLLRVTAAAVVAIFGSMIVEAFADVPFASDEVVAQKAEALTGDPGSPVICHPHANVTIIEFFDYDCPYCKAAEPRLGALVKSDKGTKLVLKEFPILTPASMVATKAALASVKQGKYAQFHNALMNYKGPLETSVIFDTAEDVGLNIVRLRKDRTAPRITDEIIANFNLARSLRIFQTPAFIVGDHILTGPSADVDFTKAVAAARAK
jgi:protein-disulfide isomerase